MVVLRILMLLAGVVLSAVLPVGGVARAEDEEDSPQLDGSLETRSYTDAATREVLFQYAYVIGEVDRFPGNPTPDEVKKTNFRKRLLDLRLMMDYNAFAYKQGGIDRYRDLVDEAYETVGLYKDLYDVNASFDLPIDPSERDHRFNAMLNAVAPLRQADVRAKFEKAVDDDESRIATLDSDKRPRLWQIAGLEPTDELDSAGNAARLGQAVLLNLRDEGLLVGDIFDPAQEARFHDVRKALRSVLVISDIFPSLSAAAVEVREPLDDLVKAYGKTNDQVVGYHEAQASGQPLDERSAALSKAFDKSEGLAREFVDTGQLDAFVAALATAEASHHR